jgi:hypothetical protein
MGSSPAEGQIEQLGFALATPQSGSYGKMFVVASAVLLFEVPPLNLSKSWVVPVFAVIPRCQRPIPSRD